MFIINTTILLRGVALLFNFGITEETKGKNGNICVLTALVQHLCVCDRVIWTLFEIEENAISFFHPNLKSHLFFFSSAVCISPYHLCYGDI